MANTATHQTTGFGRVSEHSEFTFFERMILRRFHPISLFFDMTGLIWVTYFLWQNQWQNALIVIVAERLLATSIVWRIDLKAMAETSLGKLGLLHLHPINLMVQIVGAAGTVWALWTHSTLYILAGLSVIILGHTFGWSEVNPSFSLRDKTAG